MKQTAIILLLFVVSFVSKAQTSDSIVINLSDGEKPARMYVFPADKDNNKHRAVVICPGGGYSRLAMDHEGFKWVPFFREEGFTTVILEYRMPKGNPLIPVGDAAKAILTVRANARQWDIDPQQVGIMGFSAGGHLASTITVTTDSTVRPSFSVLMYPVVSMHEDFMHRRSHKELLGADASDETNRRYSAYLHVDSLTPPTFIALSSNDAGVPPQNSLRFYEAMVVAKRPVAIHAWPTGSHGWGMSGKLPYYQEMLGELRAWLRRTVGVKPKVWKSKAAAKQPQ